MAVELGVAIAWWNPRETTWSNTPAGLLAALQRDERVHVTGIEAQRSVPGKVALHAVARTLTKDPWQVLGLNRRLMARAVRRRSAHCDAVLALGEVEAQLDRPVFLFQDCNFAVLREYRDLLERTSPGTYPYTLERLDSLATEQRAHYRAASGVFAMGEWYRQWLVEHDGVPAARAHAVGGALLNVPQRRVPAGAPHRLLFIGRDFARKGGDIAVEAVRRLRASGSGDLRLTVIGPAAWPLDGAPPEWVDFRGAVPAREVARLWAEHDVFVQPSWFEPYGIAFLEARAAGVPTVARNAFSMPDLVQHAGRLVDREAGAEQVAAAIADVCADDALYARLAAEADAVVADYTWTAVADRVLDVVLSAPTVR